MSSAKYLPFYRGQLSQWHSDATMFVSMGFENGLAKSIHVAYINTLRPRPNRRHFADDIFKYIFLNENVWIPIKISLKFVPKGRINNISALVQIMAWRRPGDKPLSEPMMVSLPTHICVTRCQWVKENAPLKCSASVQTRMKTCLNQISGHFSPGLNELTELSNGA